VGNHPLGILLTVDNKIYVVNSDSNNVSVIDASTNTVNIPPIVVGKSPVGIAVTPDGKKVYVTNSDSNSVSVIDTTTNAVTVPSIAVGNNPGGIAVTPDGKKVYVANINSNSVSVIDVSTNTITTSSISVGNGPIAFGNFITTVDVSQSVSSESSSGGCSFTQSNSHNFKIASLLFFISIGLLFSRRKKVKN